MISASFWANDNSHHWWDWYAPYLSALQSGGSADEAAAAADGYMDDVFHVLPR